MPINKFIQMPTIQIRKSNENPSEALQTMPSSSSILEIQFIYEGVLLQIKSLCGLSISDYIMSLGIFFISKESILEYVYFKFLR